MTKSRGIRKQHNVGDIIIRPDGTQWKVGEDRKWIYIKKPKGYFKKDQPKQQKAKPVFPPIKLPDHIKPTKYPRYYVSNDGIAYREPRPIDANGKFGEVNEYGLIELTTSLRGNPNHGEEFMYEGINIYFYDETGKNMGSKKRNIHQLVAETWIPNPHGYNEVLHGIKGNRCNHIDNLRWGTHAENMKESSNTLPEGAIIYHNRNTTHHDGCKRNPTKYIKKDGKWVLISSDKPAWNKGLRSGAADGTLKKCLNGYWKVKEDGKWNHIKQKDYDKHSIKTDI
tara:strand:+ start:532 stop:1377 length:846 start_codon:yes stop_codon:yes gene_type:complete